MPDDDVLADRYVIADERLGAAGMTWYEVSNWAVSAESACRHNQLYWTGGDWWGIGPGAHSHAGGTRWWNVRHPAAYAQRITAGLSPAQAREALTAAEQATERIMLATRLVEGCPAALLPEAGKAAAERAVADGLAEAGAWRAGRVVLTRRGRLLAERGWQQRAAIGSAIGRWAEIVGPELAAHAVVELHVGLGKPVG